MLAITKPQLIKINRSLNDYLHLKQMYANLKTDLSYSDSLCVYWKQTALKNDTLYLLRSKQYEETVELNGSLTDSLSKEKSKSRKLCIGVGVGGTILGLIIGFLLSK